MSNYSLSIDVRDLYGRAIPGAIIVILMYGLLVHSRFSFTTKEILSDFADMSITLVAISFFLISFLAGHIPYFIARTVESKFRKAPQTLIDDNIIPIRDFEIVDLKLPYKGMFIDESLKRPNSNIILFCKQYLLTKDINAYTEIKLHESQRNLRGSLGWSLISVFAYFSYLACGGFNWQLFLYLFFCAIPIILIWNYKRYPARLTRMLQKIGTSKVLVCGLILLSIFFSVLIILLDVFGIFNFTDKYSIFIILSLWLGLVFIVVGVRSLWQEDALTLRLYYHAISNKK